MIEIAGREIGPHRPPYIVAEISGNHGGDPLKAVELIKAAKEAGADAAKFQYYKPEDLAVPGSKYWDIYQQCQVKRNWLDVMFHAAGEAGITLFASVFAPWAIKDLEEFNCPAYKVASPEAKNFELLTACRATGKPVIVSTGILKADDIVWHSDVILHCVAQYPTLLRDMNLRAIGHWDGLAGLSDHTSGIEAPIAATALGAVMIEKHFGLDDKCVDAEFSLTPSRFTEMVAAVNAVWLGLGDGIPKPTCQPRQKEAA